MSTLVKRILSAIVMIGALVCLIYIGGPVIWVAVSAISITAEWELGKALGYGQTENGKKPLLIVGMVMSVLMYMICWLYDYKIAFLLCPSIYLIIVFAFYVFKYGKYSVKDVACFILIFMYISIFLAFIPVVRECLPHGMYMVWILLIPSIASDTFAYFVGSAIGKHKLAPVVSPKKSIEGSVGGVIGSALIMGLYGLFLSHNLSVKNGFIIVCVLIGLVVGGVSQIGDLAASAIKREVGIKDYGNIIPGHGGALDRIDSIIYVAPVIYIGVYVLTTYFM